MTPRRRRPLEKPFTSAPWIAAVLVSGLAAVPVSASCQTYACRVSYCRHHLEEAEQRRRALDQPELAAKVWESVLALDSPEHIVSCRRLVAVYDSRFRWEPQPILELPAAELEAQARAEARRLLERLLASGAGDGGRIGCRLAELLDGPEARVGALRRGAEADPADPHLASCLARELAAQGRAAEAEAHLRGFLDDHPEPTAFDALFDLLTQRRAAAERRALLEERARRRPDGVEGQVALLAHYAEQRLFPERDAHLASLEPRFALAARWRLCDALDRGTADAAEIACLERLLDESAAGGAALSEDELGYVRLARDRLLFDGIHAKSWPRIEEVLAGVPHADLLDAWNKVLAWLKADACPRFLAAYRGGAFREALAEPYHAPSLARHLEGCGAVEEAKRLRAPAAATLAAGELAWMPAEEGVPELRRRLAESPDRRELHRALAEAARALSAEEQAALLAGWAEALPGEVEPLLLLASLEEKRARGDAALRRLEEAARRDPERLDLLVGLGTAALRHRRHEVAADAARRLLAAPAANPRETAEARYLLGRVALRDGRAEEASEHLAAYFLARLRFAGCYGVRGAEETLACDEPLVLHLLRSGGGERLERYLAARAVAVAGHERTVEVADTERRRSARPPSVGPRGGACTRAALAGPPGRGGPFPDPDPLFADDELLALSSLLTEVH
ncbi:MAG TPA: hypothetical protein VF121_07540 [Thermoanaerobaculia bacterium]|nr:hypothetical protein [Thermoanaerobaculia bacterium]